MIQYSHSEASEYRGFQVELQVDISKEEIVAHLAVHPVDMSTEDLQRDGWFAATHTWTWLEIEQTADIGLNASRVVQVWKSKMLHAAISQYKAKA